MNRRNFICSSALSATGLAVTVPAFTFGRGQDAVNTGIFSFIAAADASRKKGGRTIELA